MWREGCALALACGRGPSQSRLRVVYVHFGSCVALKVAASSDTGLFFILADPSVCFFSRFLRFICPYSRSLFLAEWQLFCFKCLWCFLSVDLLPAPRLFPRPTQVYIIFYLFFAYRRLTVLRCFTIFFKKVSICKILIPHSCRRTNDICIQNRVI